MCKTYNKLNVTNSKVFLFGKFNIKLRSSVLHNIKERVTKMITKGVGNEDYYNAKKMFLLYTKNVLTKSSPIKFSLKLFSMFTNSCNVKNLNDRGGELLDFAFLLLLLLLIT